MSALISSFIPFPNIAWWSLASHADSLYLDGEEAFRKMSYRNRYYLCGPQGWICLTIPIKGGREQRSPMKDLAIDQSQHWGKQHWRTLCSNYNRSPYFSYYAPELQVLLETPRHWLIDFHLQTIEWIADSIGCNLPLVLDPKAAKLDDENGMDLRSWKPGIEKQGLDKAPYYQLFLDRNPFYPNLSVLDLLFQQGPHSLNWIQNHPSWTRPWAAGMSGGGDENDASSILLPSPLG